MAAKHFQSGSSSKSQWERLLGSFQSITASTVIGITDRSYGVPGRAAMDPAALEARSRGSSCAHAALSNPRVCLSTRRAYAPWAARSSRCVPCSTMRP